MRKGTKVLAAFIAAATASAMSLTAFAAPTITGNTTYTGTDEITVTTNVTGAVANEEVAYLVYKSDKAATDDGAILFIDQKTADSNGSATFTFTGSKADIVNAVGSTVKVGTSSTANGADLTDATTLKLESFDITYSSGANGKAYAVVAGEIVESPITTLGEVTFAVTADAGYEFSKVLVNDVEKVGVAPNADNLLTLTLAADDVVSFEFKAISSETAVSATTTVGGGSVSYTEGTEDNSVIARGKAAGFIKEAGMFISAGSAELAAQKDSGSANLITGNTNKVGKFAALALGSDGSFAIQLLENLSSDSASVAADYEPFITSATMYGLSYVVKADDSVVFGDVVQIQE